MGTCVLENFSPFSFFFEFLFSFDRDRITPPGKTASSFLMERASLY
jgi:hypothetical protein